MSSPTCQDSILHRVERPVSPAPMLRAAWVVTAVFILSNAATPLYGYWRAQLGFGAATQAAIFAVYIVGLLAALLIAGQVSDHFGRKPVLLPAIVGAMVAAVLFEMAHSVAVLMVARFLTGVAIGGIVSAGMANVVDSAGDGHKRQASLLASIAMVLGAGLGPFIAGLFAQYAASPVPLVFGMELVLLLAALACVIVLPARELPQTAFRPRLPSVPAGTGGYVLRGVAFFGPGLTTTSFVLSLGPNLFAAALHINSPLIAGCTAFGMFMMAVGAQIACRRVAIQRTFALSGFATAASMLTLWASVTTASAAWLVVAALLAGMGQGLGQLGGFTLIALHIPANRRAEANGLMNMGAYIPAGLMPVGAGVAIDRLGLVPGVTILSGVIAALTALALLWICRRPAA